MLRSVSKVFLFVFVILINVRCAYHFGAVKRSLPGAYDRVAVPVFKNATPETGIETYFTKAMVEEVARGHIAAVTDKDAAQILIEGEIKKVDYIAGATIQHDQNNFPDLPRDTELIKEYRILIETQMQVRRKSDQQVIWTGTFKGERRYPAPLVTKPIFNTVNPLYNQSSRYQNIEVIAKDMMAEAYSRMTEDF